jgi:hypothetical protein
MAAAVTVLALALSACAGGESPGGNGTPSSVSDSATPSATPTPTPTASYKPADANGRAQNVPLPEVPEAAKAETKEGLEAFAKYWYSLLSFGFETGDPSEWSKLTSPNCAFCNTLKTSIEIGYKSNRWQVGGRISTPSIDARIDETAPMQQVTVQVLQEATEYYKADGTVGREPEPASNTASVVIAGYKDGAWTVSDIHLLK